MASVSACRIDLDEDNKLVYAEYLENVNSEPNYQAAIEAVKAL